VKKPLFVVGFHLGGGLWLEGRRASLRSAGEGGGRKVSIRLSARE